jgi:hypothetical protein
MAYPTVSAPYGLKPVNLIGGQVFAGSTREYDIQYGYATSIYYGDVVSLARGFANRATVGSTATAGSTGVFLGCSYTNPTTKQKMYSQYWPANTLAGDAVAIIADDPDTVFKAAVCSGTTVIGATSKAMIGQNMAMIDNTGNANTGNSANAVLAVVASGAPATTSSLPVRVLDVVGETAVVLSVPSTSTATTTITIPASPVAIPAGSGVAFIAANGQVVETGSFVTTAVAVGGTSISLNVASIVTIPASATIVLTQYTEVLVKLNFGISSYYTATAA